MAVIERERRSSLSVRLNAGTNPANGAMIVKSCSLGKVVRGANGEKVMNVVEALAPVLKHPVAEVVRTEVTVLEA